MEYTAEAAESLCWDGGAKHNALEQMDVASFA